jgi:kynurenine 3-monooxygenase
VSVEAEQEENVELKFKHKLVNVDLGSGQMEMMSPDGNCQETTDLVMGCDGAFSSVRKAFVRNTRFNYSQEYIPHGYKELVMPAKDNGKYAMETNYLHIWPRHTFMMIALPNLDGSFTCTLFMPFDLFDTIKTKDDIIAFFQREFPDSIPLFGQERLLETYRANPVGSLISVKCSPYHVGGKALLMGDAAHAMVPFYGQGMNAGFEDCFVLHELLEKHHGNMEAALAEYTETRNKDAETICDLAMYNYVEMRSHVTSKWFLMKKKIDNFLHWVMPSTFIPLYSMVTFSNIPYHIARERWHWQDKMIYRGLFCVGMIAVVTSVGLVFHNWVEENPWKAWILRCLVSKSIN